jgi:YceI-like domain
MNHFGFRHRVFVVTQIVVLSTVFTEIVCPQTRTQASSGEIVLQLDPAQSKVHWTLSTTLHTVHGTFSFKSGSLQLDPATGKVRGDIIVDAVSGQSGNNSRDKRMHREILESQRYTEVLFRPDRVEGKISLSGSSSAQLHGVFVLHGGEHELTVPVQVELDGDHWKGSANFAVPYVQWGLKNPSNFLLRVNKAVEIEAVLAGKLQQSATP